MATPSSPAPTRIGGTAVVIGASMAGVCAARVWDRGGGVARRPDSGLRGPCRAGPLLEWTVRNRLTKHPNIAGYTKDPITAQGICNAFSDAERVSAALHQVWSGTTTFDDALGACQLERDESCLPMYEFTTRLAALEPPPQEMQALLAAMVGNQPAMDAFVSLNTGTMSPPEFFDPAHLAGLSEPAGA